MTHPWTKGDLTKGKELLAKGQVGPVVFSQGTYQVEVKESKSTTYWPFLQLTDTGEVKDAFCTCKRAEEKGGCPHLAASFLKIVDQLPLHVRFRESLWNILGHLGFERHGDNPKGLEKSQGVIKGHDLDGTLLFSLTPKSEKASKELEQLLFKRKPETEENSIKFSNLSVDELTKWKEGRPSEALRYELSYWADLAKKWFLAQEGEVPYTITFSEETIPEYIHIDWKDCIVVFHLDLPHTPQVIESLKTVDAPLKIHPYAQGNLETISFNRAKGELHLNFSKVTESKRPKDDAIEVGDYLLVPEDGFYPNEKESLLTQPVIKRSSVSEFFEQHLFLLQEHLLDETIHTEQKELQHNLWFDPKERLHVESYLFSKGDLQQKGAFYFGSWVYLPDDGFYPIEQHLFHSATTVVARNNVADFVNRHRIFLQNIDGFQPHVSGVESHIGFGFNKAGKLHFFTRHEFTEQTEEILDFGEWIYVKEKGFYAKTTARTGLVIKPGMEIESHEIPSFIEEHKDELETLPGFFNSQCPITKAGLIIDFTSHGHIQITPEFLFAPHLVKDQVSFYGDYTFVDGEGFAEIPPNCRLPKGYHHHKVIDQSHEAYFVSYELEALYPFATYIDPKIQRPSKLILAIDHLKRDPHAKTGQWILEMSFLTDIGKTPLHTLWQAKEEGRSYLFSEAGLFFLHQKRFDWLMSQNKKRWLQKGSALRMHTLDFLRVLALETIQEPQGDGKKAKLARKTLQDFLDFRPPSEPNLSGLLSDLRTYQKVGLSWLWFLYSFGLSGLLCDEMGLGKTHQAMALIQSVHNAHRAKRKAKFLVVCPTSVIYHWQTLIETFLPNIRPYIFHGLGRKFSAFTEGSYDLLLTSYGIVRTENKALASFDFDLAVFDELQVAKNAKSLTHKSLANISAAMRLGLSGTPIENRLQELKSLLDLVLPKYLPNQATFREQFVGPIEKHQDHQRRDLLKRLVHPFILRRKKAEVLLELPEKIEEIALCDLSQEQYNLYQKELKAHREPLLKELQDTSSPPPIAHIFSLLSKLKQICNHPALYHSDPRNYKKYHSGKWELFQELLSEVEDSGQKLVVFSQYLGMLDILGSHLKEQNIPFAEIRGSTKDRKEEVERFATDPNCKVFLGSLQAAGVGIDLISASVVIHYDRWWNPAKENQATDRVHRMGQKRGVQVFKLMTKDTIEEKIDELIRKKQALAQGIIGFDEHDQIKGLSRDDLIALLQALG